MPETLVGTETPAKTGAPKFGATVEVQASHLAMFAKRFNLDPQKMTDGQIMAALKEHEREALSEFTTKEQQESFKVLFDDTRVWLRTGDRTKTLHRVLNVFPEFTGQTGEDFVNCDDADASKVGVKAVYKVAVERFKETDQPDRKIIRESLGSFQMKASSFISEFEAR